MDKEDDNNHSLTNASKSIKKTYSRWSKEEDNKLISLIDKAEFIQAQKKWKKVSKFFPFKNAKQCFNRYNRIKSQVKKGKWTNDEDIKIRKYVQTYGLNWSKISKFVVSRSPKQIRDRYVNYLNPFLINSKFTEEEDCTLLSLVKELGFKWVKISSILIGRSPVVIKNKYYSLIRIQNKTTLCEIPKSKDDCLEYRTTKNNIFVITKIPKVNTFNINLSSCIHLKNYNNISDVEYYDNT